MRNGENVLARLLAREGGYSAAVSSLKYLPSTLTFSMHWCVSGGLRLQVLASDVMLSNEAHIAQLLAA